MTRVELPWPSSALSPNARGHWSIVAKAKAAYRKAAWAICIANGLGKLDASAIHLTLTFCPPCKRRRDADNLLASMKAGIDGIADATGIDDSTYTITLARGPVRRGGAVLADIEVAP
ncbi:hypothetical protein [Falsirhodobacter sp. 20TX0035]|uniref:hypothetical protein n=1 Tax=Falsirhodobacter sp. 20TX0035 TaxID=3022019 RepID=UPI00232B5FDB|nr:hypothetical protein [Falsirhodobacter sp. 20TX0035]MDB6454730.1 hypothetical protein [Falsirhodobacter sp. 20TX0035]